MSKQIDTDVIGGVLSRFEQKTSDAIRTAKNDALLSVTSPVADREAYAASARRSMAESEVWQEAKKILYDAVYAAVGTTW